LNDMHPLQLMTGLKYSLPQCKTVMSGQFLQARKGDQVGSIEFRIEMAQASHLQDFNRLCNSHQDFLNGIDQPLLLLKDKIRTSHVPRPSIKWIAVVSGDEKISDATEM